MNQRFGNQGPITPAILNLIIINVILFVAKLIFANNQILNLDKLLGLYFPQNEHFKIWQIITHMFMHADLTHLAFNMFSLWMFGTILEKVWGAKRFLIFYFVTGLGAALCYIGVQYYNFYQAVQSANLFLAHPSAVALSNFLQTNSLHINDQALQILEQWKLHPNDLTLIESFKRMMIDYKTNCMNLDGRFSMPVIGASGAVYGVLLAYGYLFPNTTIYLRFIIPVKAKYLVLILAAVEMFENWRVIPGDNVAHVAHLGGMLFGFILVYYWNKTNKNSFY
jgi:membrane associated rhomboid family serine protease